MGERGARGGRGRGAPRGGVQRGGQPQQGYPRPPPQKLPESVSEAITATSTSAGSGVAEITSQLGAVTLRDEYKLPRRPGHGTNGRVINLISNFYPMQFPDRNIYQYDVAITPEAIRPAPTNRRILTAWKKLPTHDANQIEVIRLIVYDGQKTFYCPGRLNLGETGEMSWDIELGDEDGSSTRVQNFKIKIQETTIVEMERLHQYLNGGIKGDVPRDAIAVVETLLRQRPATIFANKNSKSGGSFYQLYDRNAIDLSGGLVVQQGWYQAARPSIKQLLMLNLDVSATSFYKPGPLLDVVCNFFGVRSIRDIRQEVFAKGREKLVKFLKQVTIKINYREHGRKKYKIKGLSSQGADKQLMKIPEEDTRTEGSPYFGQSPNKKITVAQYYQQMFGVKLSYSYFPAVLSGANNQIHIPMELCIVKENQRYIGKLNETQLASMIKITATSPAERFKRIETGRTQLHNEKEQLTMLQSWGVSISPKPQELTGRVLESPRMNQGSGGGGGGRGGPRGGRGGGGGGGSSVLNANFGQWRLEKFYKPAELKFWSVLIVGERLPREDRVYKFVEVLCQQLQGKGIKIANEEPEVILQKNGSIRNSLIEANKKSRPNDGGGPSPDKRAELILVILCEKTLYSEVKRVAEVDLGIMTQCCLAKHIDKAAPAYCGNLALKINAKLGGVNNILVPDALNDVKQVSPLSNSRVMIFGADVTHPSPQQQRDPNAISIAALTASIDKDFWDYRASVRTQTGKEEVIKDITEMVSELIGHYRRNNQGQLPNRIVFYRDGVSEGQFAEILINEFPMIKKAFATVLKDPPKITFIVINKRHHVRFLPKNMQDADKSGNIPAGTVVDTVVTHPYEFDFFLASHAGLQGTSKPSHYHVLYDENGFNSNELQALTNRLCYLFNRCSRSVSMVPSAYYAHLVAARARCHAGVSDDFSEASGEASRFGETKVNPVVRSRMYFA